MTSPPKITAEWIVRAQLTICRPDNTPKTQNLNDDPDTNYAIDRQPLVERHFDNENPIKVVYKWSSNDPNTGDSASVVETVLSAPNNASNVSSKDSGSFRSTGVTSSDSGIGTTTASVTNQFEKSKIRSTCNIILTACTNVIPEPTEMVESFPTTYYTLFPDNEVRFKHVYLRWICEMVHDFKAIFYFVGLATISSDQFVETKHSVDERRILANQRR